LAITLINYCHEKPSQLSKVYFFALCFTLALTLSFNNCTKKIEPGNPEAKASTSSRSSNNSFSTQSEEDGSFQAPSGAYPNASEYVSEALTEKGVTEDYPASDVFFYNEIVYNYVFGENPDGVSSPIAEGEAEFEVPLYYNEEKNDVYVSKEIINELYNTVSNYFLAKGRENGFKEDEKLHFSGIDIIWINDGSAYFTKIKLKYFISMKRDNMPPGCDVYDDFPTMGFGAPTAADGYCYKGYADPNDPWSYKNYFADKQITDRLNTPDMCNKLIVCYAQEVIDITDPKIPASWITGYIYSKMAVENNNTNNTGPVIYPDGITFDPKLWRDESGDYTPYTCMPSSQIAEYYHYIYDQSLALQPDYTIPNTNTVIKKKPYEYFCKGILNDNSSAKNAPKGVNPDDWFYYAGFTYGVCAKTAVLNVAFETIAMKPKDWRSMM
jgi:hypothetical protein